VALRVRHEIEAVTRRLAPIGDGLDQLIESAGLILLGETLQLGIDGLVQLPRQQHRRVPIDIDHRDRGRRAEQREVGQR